MLRSVFKIFLTLLIVVVLFWSQFAGAQVAREEESSLKQAEEYFRKGQYEDALRLYQEAGGTDIIAGVVGASRIWTLTGEYEKAEEICRRSLKELPDDTKVG